MPKPGQCLGMTELDLSRIFEQASEVARVRQRFYQVMWLTYVAIVGLSTLVASLRFAMGEDGSLHHFLSTTSSHLVLVRFRTRCLCNTHGMQRVLKPSSVPELACLPILSSLTRC